MYHRNAQTIGLYDDAASVVSSKGLGSSATLQNGQCAVGYAVMYGSGSQVILQVNLLLKPAFSGVKNVYLQPVQAGGGAGWTQVGTWTVP